jgi:hypothetical protein
VSSSGLGGKEGKTDQESPEEATKAEKKRNDDGRASAEGCTAGQGLGRAVNIDQHGTTPDSVYFTTTTTTNDPDW